MVHAFATEAGGRASHTAIMAGVLEIPAVVGLGKFLTDVSGGDEVIVDGNRGVLILNPDEETLRTLRDSPQQSSAPSQTRLDELARPARRDQGRHTRPAAGQHRVSPGGEHCLERGADGVGLYRTEFLYLNKTDDPDRGGASRSLSDGRAHAWAEQPVVIRTLDLGADKFADQVGTVGTTSAIRSWACAACACACGI